MGQDKERKHVVSVSLGSSKRDHAVETVIMDVPFRIERIGTDGSMDKAIQMISDLDGKVDAFGLGGIDIWLQAGEKKYVIKDAMRLMNAAKKTPVFDGSVLKNSIEKDIIHKLYDEGKYINKDSRVLIPTSTDRFGMAEAFHEVGVKAVYGDLLLAIGIPITVSSFAMMKFLAQLLLPFYCKLPIEKLYPTGTDQDKRTPRGEKYFNWATVIAGDFIMIHKYMPSRLDGKVILTNTTTKNNVEELKKAGVRALITTTPELEGRSFGTNVMEGVFSVLLGKTGENPPTQQELIDLSRKLNLPIRIVDFTE